MSKKRGKKHSEDDDNWTTCSFCGESVKSKNFENHLERVHLDISDDDIDREIESSQPRKKTQRRKKSEMRKEIEQQKKRKQDILTFFGLIIVIGAILAAYFVFSGSSESTLGPESAQNTDVQAGTNQIVIPMTEVDDGEAHFYKYNHNGVEIRYFLLKSSDGVVRAAFDACDVCFREKKGYHQEGDLMVCNNCGQEFESVNINVLQGGCNPAPLDRTYDDNSVTITTDDLAKGAKYF